MPVYLRYPPDLTKPTITLQLFLDCQAAPPTVAETGTIGYPYEITQLVLSASRGTGTIYTPNLIIATQPFTAGNALDGIRPVAVAGDLSNGDPTALPYCASAPLRLRPRIRVPMAGTRLRLVEQQVAPVNVLRAVFTLTPLD